MPISNTPVLLAVPRNIAELALLVLYDMTSSYLEGRCCPLARFGHNRDAKRGKQQIAIGLLCTGEGCPIAVEVFCGNTADPSTVPAQVAKLKERFNVQRIALVGDRGMLTTARIRESVAPMGLDWISALKTGDLRKLLKPLDGGRGARRCNPTRWPRSSVRTSRASVWWCA